MAILNITYGGVSADYPLDGDAHLTDADVRRIATEVVRAGGVRGMRFPGLPENAFDFYVVDRASTRRGENRIYLRPKVPFGAARLRQRGARGIG
jgi:hypothetical protein